MIKKIDCVAIPVKAEDMETSIDFYTSIGLSKSWELKRDIGNGVIWTTVGMKFPEGGSDLVLQDHPEIKTLDIELQVESVSAAYQEISQNPDVEWIKVPLTYTDVVNVAVFKAPDGNVFVLIGGK